jgi:hypothetical protein
MDQKLAEQIAIEIAKQSGSFGGSIWIASLVVVGGAVMAILHFWFILIPNAKSRRENDQKIADTLILMGASTTETKNVVTGIAVTTSGLNEVVHQIARQVHETNGRTRRMLNAKVALVRAAQKIAEKTDTDIAAELGEMRGALADINAPITESMFGSFVEHPPADRPKH